MVYQPGELKVETYKNGKPWAVDSVKTAGVPAKPALSADRSGIRADGLDLSFVTVRVLDTAGVAVRRASDSIRFKIEGPGETIATDNGDAIEFATVPIAGAQSLQWHSAGCCAG